MEDAALHGVTCHGDAADGSSVAQGLRDTLPRSMRSPGALPRNVALAVLFSTFLAWFLTAQVFVLDGAQELVLGKTLAAIAGIAIAIDVAAAWWLAAPLRRAGAATPGNPAADVPEDVGAAMRLPFRLAAIVFASSSAATAVTMLRVRSAMSADDLVLAAAGVGVACALLAGLLAYALGASYVAEQGERLGVGAAAARPGTVRSKILALGLGLDTIALVLLAACAYGRYRLDVDAEYLESGKRAQAAALSGSAAALSNFDAAAQVWLATGAPTALLDGNGALRHRFGQGDVPFAEAIGAPSVLRLRTGWLLKAPVPEGGHLVSWLPEAPLWERRRAFWGNVFAVAFVAYAAAALLVWIAARAITLPFRTLGRAANRIASGDLTASAPSLSRDEMGQLASDFRRMAQGLKGLVVDVQAASEGVSSGAREATGIGDRVRAGALEQHEGVRAVQGAVEAMEGSMALVSRGVGGLSAYIAAAKTALGELAEVSDELRRKGGELDRTMDSTLKDVDRLAVAGREADGTLHELESLAGHAGGTLASVRASLAGLEHAAGEAETNAAAVDELAARAGDVVLETVHGIESLRSAVSDAHRRVAALGRRSEDVFQVVVFISEVAGRTNLLSLNASIIAAQAGEHGKAFAVVADQIRELAAQIARSTKSIGDIIQSVREDVEGTASLIERGDGLAADGVQLARNSLEALGRIQRSTSGARETAASIRAAVETHAESSREVSRLVESVTDGSRAVSGAVQLVARSVAGVGSVSRNVNAIAEQLTRALEEQGRHGKRQVERLVEVERMIADIARAVQAHDAATRRVRDTLRELSHATGTHESAVHGLAGVADQLDARARALADRVNRFKV